MEMGTVKDSISKKGMEAKSERLIREIPLIERYSRHNEAEDYSFRAFLKVRSKLSNIQMDALAKQTTEEVWSQIDCKTCGNCCRSLEIVVDDQDIARLAGRFKQTVQLFSRQYVRVAPDRTKHFESPPCPFLGEDNLCEVYEDRPKACRDFPYLHEEGFRGRTISMIANSSLCPIVFNVWQRMKTKLGFRKVR